MATKPTPMPFFRPPCISVALLCVLNYLLYLVIVQQWGFLGEAFAATEEQMATLHGRLVIALVVETVIFSFALIYLAMQTSHRIGGPYLRLGMTFCDIRDGNRELRLKFRKYDNLDSLAKEFNEMLEALYAEQEEAGPAKGSV